jgi:hypothetical protein
LRPLGDDVRGKAAEAPFCCAHLGLDGKKVRVAHGPTFVILLAWTSESTRRRVLADN